MEVRLLGPLELADGERRSRTGSPPAGCAGRAAEARVTVSDALGLYGRKGNLLAAARARRRLERLALA